jgi:hypothetical protein
MLDKTITNALIALRKQIIRESLDGLPHVDALLAARGVDPAQIRIGGNRPAWPLCRECCVEDSVHYWIMDTIGVSGDEAAEASGLV